jgi:predicted DNA-binding protein (UPF0251 family)
LSEALIHPEDAASNEAAFVTRFVSAVEGAAVLLKAAHPDELAVLTKLSRTPVAKAEAGWKEAVVTASAVRAVQVINVLVKHPAGGGLAVPEFEAFKALAALTPAATALRKLAASDRGRAYIELRTQIELLAQQLQATARVDECLETTAETAAARNASRFEALKAELLQQAGGGLSLTEAAKRLGVSRQAMHKSIHSNRALGMMSGDAIVVPAFQFIERDGKTILLPGLDRVTKLFRETEAGGWAELQFLFERDPNLQALPVTALLEGKVDAAVQVARAHLRMDEG